MVLIAIAIAVISAMGWHVMLSKHYWVASSGSAATSAALSWLIASSHMRTSDMLFIVVFAFVIAAAVGSLFKKIEQRKSEK